MAYCQGCGHHHRTPHTRCTAITHEPDGGAARCNCPTPQHQTGKDQPV